MKKSFIFILLTFTGCNVFAQNYLFEPNSSGFHIAGQVSTSSTSTILGIRPGYTFNGKITIGLVVGSENITDLNLNSTAIRPYLDFLALKQDRDIPLSLNLGVHYQYNSFPKIPGLTFNTIGFSVNALHSFDVGGNTQLIPGIGIGWDKTTVSLVGYSGNVSSIGFGLSTAVKFNNFYLEPLVSFQKGGTQITLSVGVIFPY
jgi:hypothetical protein